MEKPSQECQHYAMDIQPLLGKNERVLEPFPIGRPPNRGFEHAIDIE